MDPSDAAYPGAQIAKNPFPGYFSVNAHGDWDGVSDTEGGLSPELLAQKIKNAPNYKGSQPVVLISCYAGSGEYAQKLADLLRVPVIAPNTSVRIVGKNEYLPEGHTELYLYSNKYRDWIQFEPKPRPVSIPPGRWAHEAAK